MRIFPTQRARRSQPGTPHLFIRVVAFSVFRNDRLGFLVGLPPAVICYSARRGRLQFYTGDRRYEKQPNRHSWGASAAILGKFRAFLRIHLYVGVSALSFAIDADVSGNKKLGILGRIGRKCWVCCVCFACSLLGRRGRSQFYTGFSRCADQANRHPPPIPPGLSRRLFRAIVVRFYVCTCMAAWPLSVLNCLPTFRRASKSEFAGGVSGYFGSASCVLRSRCWVGEVNFILTFVTVVYKHATRHPWAASAANMG